MYLVDWGCLCGEGQFAGGCRAPGWWQMGAGAGRRVHRWLRLFYTLLRIIQRIILEGKQCARVQVGPSNAQIWLRHVCRGHTAGMSGRAGGAGCVRKVRTEQRRTGVAGLFRAPA